MKGLLWKDYFIVKKYCKIILLMVVIFAAAGARDPGNSFFLLYPVILTSVIPVTLISYDEKSKWTLYADVLPCSRATAVSTKYIAVCISLIICLAATEGAQIIRMAVRHSWDAVLLLQICFLFVTVGLALPGLMLPAIFRLGTEKGRILYYISIGVICAASGILTVNRTEISHTQPLWIAALGAAALFVCSWLLAIRLYQGRELS